MDDRFSGLIVTAAIAITANAAISVSVTRAAAQAPFGSGAAMQTPLLKTAWGEPDLQGIWTDEVETPLQRPAKYANQEDFTAAQRTELDTARSDLLDKRANDREYAGAYNLAAFTTIKRAGPRGIPRADQPDAVAAGARDAVGVRQSGQPDPPAAERTLERRPARRAVAASRTGPWQHVRLDRGQHLGGLADPEQGAERGIAGLGQVGERGPG